MEKEAYRILVVDDEEDLCEILQFNLEGEGFETDVAYSAEEALQKDLASYHLILLDVMMGEMSGFKLAKLIRKDRELNTPIIFITAKTEEDELLTGFNLGADDYITKPFSVKEVIARVRAVLNRSPQDHPPGFTKLVADELVVNLKKRKVKVGKKEIELTRKEFDRDEKIQAVTAIFDELHIRKVIEQRINEFYERALSSLKQLNKAEDRKAELYSFASFLLTRNR